VGETRTKNWKHWSTTARHKAQTNGQEQSGEAKDKWWDQIHLERREQAQLPKPTEVQKKKKKKIYVTMLQISVMKPT
jgi:hypothetical protein